MPFFSIVIPTYNRANYLSKTMRSILNQTFKDFELIIIDDGSTDDTESVISQTFSTDQRVIYHWKANEERGAARNFGFKKAKGKYVVFFDSDDIMKDSHLTVLYDAIIKRDEVNIWATKYDLRRNGKTYQAPIASLKEGFYNYKSLIRGAHFGTLVCVKKANENLLMFPEDRELASLEDWIFTVSNTVNDKIYLINENTITVNDHDDRSMANHKTAISVRLRATQYLLDNISFTSLEQKTIKAYSYYFCSIHSYIGHEKKQALKHIFKSINLKGVKIIFIILIIKILIGKKLIDQIRKLADV